MSQPPSLQTLRDRLTALRGIPLYDVPLQSPTGEIVGNNGDRLIRLGAEQLFQACELTFVEDPARAEVLIMGGNGGMLQHYQVVPGIFRRLWNEYPAKPLIMLPSTFYFPSQSPTSGLPVRTATVELYCREPVSYSHLLDDCHLPPCCQVGLSHDTAFALAGTPFLTALTGRPGRHVLIVERDDAEHAQRFGRRQTGPERRWRRYVPRVLKKPLYPLRAYFAGKKTTPFRQHCATILRELHPQQADLPRLVRDVSRKDYDTFESFCRAIADAEIVFTTRLHVGILAALLDKKTYLFAGPYHKIQAIYEHSLAGYKNVSLIRNDNELTSRP